MNRVPAAVMLLILMTFSQKGMCQGPVYEHKIKALKGLDAVTIVIGPYFKQETLGFKEWVGVVEAGLNRNVPSLAVVGREKTANWFELTVITTGAGSFIEISLYRWVNVIDSGEEIFTKVWWDSRVHFGVTLEEEIQQILDDLLTNFSKDYIRSNR